MMGAIYKTNFNFTKIGVMTLNSYFPAKTKKKHKVIQIAKEENGMNVKSEASRMETKVAKTTS